MIGCKNRTDPQQREMHLEYNSWIGIDGDEAQLTGKDEEEEKDEDVYIYANGNDNEETDYVKV